MSNRNKTDEDVEIFNKIQDVTNFQNNFKKELRQKLSRFAEDKSNKFFQEKEDEIITLEAKNEKLQRELVQIKKDTKKTNEINKILDLKRLSDQIDKYENNISSLNQTLFSIGILLEKRD
jgi:hypothetical protein